MSTATHRFVPALSFDALTPLYDTLVALTMRERAFRQRLLEQTELAPRQRVLDHRLRNGHASRVMLAGGQPDAAVVGLDVDARILALARDKAARAGVAVEWVQGSAIDLPFPPASFDRVTSSLMLHHLTTPEKRAALASIRRVLRPGGSLHVADFGRPHTAYTRMAAALFRYFDGPERTAANLDGQLPALMPEAGFAEVRETEHWTTAFGTLTFTRAGAGA